MSAMTPKHADLATISNAINPLGALSVIMFLGNPISDPYLENLVQDGKYAIITTPSLVVVGDLVRAGQYTGTVTAILNDGATPAVPNRIQITFDQRYSQQSGVDAPAKIVTYDFLTNANGLADVKILPQTSKLLSAGIVFLRRL